MAAAKRSVAELEKFLRKEFPQSFSDGDITIESADGETCLLRRRFDERMLRPGGTVSGPTLMAMADFAMYVVLLSAIGPVGLAVTTHLNIIFLRKGQPRPDVLAAARLGGPPGPHQPHPHVPAKGPPQPERSGRGKAAEAWEAPCGGGGQSSVG